MWTASFNLSIATHCSGENLGADISARQDQRFFDNDKRT
jgi:hypothetical protein